MARYDLHVPAGSRFDRVFTWAQANDTPMSMAGFTAVMVISAGSEQVYTSAGTDPDIILIQEPSARTGELDLTFGHALVQKLMVPYGQSAPYTYSLDLIDNAMADNSIPLLDGAVIVSRDSE